MLGRFSKTETALILDAQQSVRDAADTLAEFLSKSEVFIETDTHLNTYVRMLQRLYDAAAAACASVASFLATFTEEQQSQYEEKSERWQESERAQQVGDWLDTLAQLAEVEFPAFTLDLTEVYHTASEEDEPAVGLPPKLPSFVDFRFGVDSGQFVDYADSLEALPMSASEM